MFFPDPDDNHQITGRPGVRGKGRQGREGVCVGGRGVCVGGVHTSVPLLLVLSKATEMRGAQENKTN